jgi:DNA-binding CsgD family transcriptional regulator
VIRDDQHWLAIADLLSDAALAGDWPTALNALADACDADLGQLIGVGAGAAVPFNWMTRSDPTAISDFAAINGGDPRINPRVNVGLRVPILRAWHDIEASSDEALRRNFLYADYCRRHNVSQGSQTTLLRQDGMLIGLAVGRRYGRGVPQGDARVAFEALAPQVRAAVRMQLALEGQGAALIAGTLEALSMPAFVLDNRGRVGGDTPSAEAMVARGPLRLVNRRLGAARAEDARILADAVAAATIGLVRPGDPLVRTVVVGDHGAGGREVLDLIALPDRPFAFGFQPRALVVARGGRRGDRQLAAVLTTAFGLTPAEADVAIRLSNGETRETVARARGVSLETVRSQIKNIFAKMDLRREVELNVRLAGLR